MSDASNSVLQSLLDAAKFPFTFWQVVQQTQLEMLLDYSEAQMDAAKALFSLESEESLLDLQLEVWNTPFSRQLDHWKEVTDLAIETQKDLWGAFAEQVFSNLKPAY